jgi:endoglycosylceramidase
MSFVKVEGSRFLDASGRHLLLHGINLVNKDPSVGYIGEEGPTDFALWRSWGLNCVRLGMIWDGLEPEPGVYNEGYLQAIDQQIDWAAANDLYVILDMHQDLYSVLFADGAPAWATLTDGNPHLSESGVWSDAYFTSPAVHAAWDNFWANAAAPDGVGLQEHYAHLWAQIAGRYAGNRTVIGYDLMNEPMPGSMALQAQLLMLSVGAERLAKDAAGRALSAVELAEQWLTPEGRSNILDLLRDIAIYAPVADASEALYASFEIEKLMPFYRRVMTAIRAVDQDHIVFLGTTMSSNLGMRSHIQPVHIDEARDSLQAYAPHGYDLVTDTPDIAAPSAERIEFIFRRHGETAARLAMPALVGEWGAYDRHPGTLAPAQHVVHQFERLLFSETYWAYLPGTQEMPCFQAINRPYPARISGRLIHYSHEPSTRTFTCQWMEDPAVGAPSTVFVPEWFDFESLLVQLEPPGNIKVQPTGAGCFLEITPLADSGARRLHMTGTGYPGR